MKRASALDWTGRFTLLALVVFLAYLAVTHFTTASATPLPTGGVKLLGWQTVPSGSWITGTLQGSNSDYAEGETVPFELDIGTLNTSGNPYTFSICRDYQNPPSFGFTTLKPFNNSRAAVPSGTITSTN